MPPSVCSEAVSRPSTPRVDVEAILAGARANRDRCREATKAARTYRRAPRKQPALAMARLSELVSKWYLYSPAVAVDCPSWSPLNLGFAAVGCPVR